MEKALLAAVGCTVSAVTIMCPVDELLFVFQVCFGCFFMFVLGCILLFQFK
jgi:hypothetical protein